MVVPNQHYPLGVRPSSRSPLTMFRNSHARAPRTTWGPPFRPKRKNFSPPNRPRSRIDMRLPGSDAAPWTSRTDARPGPGDDTLTLFLGYLLPPMMFFFTHFSPRADGQPKPGVRKSRHFSHTRALARQTSPMRCDGWNFQRSCLISADCAPINRDVIPSRLLHAAGEIDLFPDDE